VFGEKHVQRIFEMKVIKMFIILQKLKNKTLNICETFPNLVKEFQLKEG